MKVCPREELILFVAGADKYMDLRQLKDICDIIDVSYKSSFGLFRYDFCWCVRTLTVPDIYLVLLSRMVAGAHWVVMVVAMRRTQTLLPSTFCESSNLNAIKKFNANLPLLADKKGQNQPASTTVAGNL